MNDFMEQFESLSRDDYMSLNNELGQQLWDNEKLPTVSNILHFYDGQKDSSIQHIIDFFDNEDDLKLMINHNSHSYSNQESNEFINEVTSSHVDQISQAGYFYKLLMASLDDYMLNYVPCENQGIMIQVNDITKKYYNTRIRMSYIVELATMVTEGYDSFIKMIHDKEITSFHVRTPLTCEYTNKRQICKLCAGSTPRLTFHIGAFTTLMITESATQAALSAMNKGVKTDINKLLQQSFTKKNPSWATVAMWINTITQQLSQTSTVGTRFYEIALLSRVHFTKRNRIVVTSFLNSINYTPNKMGAYIFSPTLRRLSSIVNTQFEDTSLKGQIAFGMDC